MQAPPPRGLPARTVLPAVLLFSVILVGLVGYLIAQAFGVTGSLFGKAGSTASAPASQGAADAVQGGPPPAVMQQLSELRKRIAAHPNDDIALTQLGDMYLTVDKFAQAIPYYQRALRANPQNPSAKEGLSQAQAGLAAQTNQ